MDQKRNIEHTQHIFLWGFLCPLNLNVKWVAVNISHNLEMIVVSRQKQISTQWKSRQIRRNLHNVLDNIRHFILIGHEFRDEGQTIGFFQRITWAQLKHAMHKNSYTTSNYVTSQQLFVTYISNAIVKL